MVQGGTRRYEKQYKKAQEVQEGTRIDQYVTVGAGTVTCCHMYVLVRAAVVRTDQYSLIRVRSGFPAGFAAAMLLGCIHLITLMQAQACFNYQPDLQPFPPLAFLPVGGQGVGGAGFSGTGGGGGASSLVAGSAAEVADAAGGAGAGSVFGQGCSLGDELAQADQGLGHGTFPAT